MKAKFSSRLSAQNMPVRDLFPFHEGNDFHSEQYVHS